MQKHCHNATENKMAFVRVKTRHISAQEGTPATLKKSLASIPLPTQDSAALEYTIRSISLRLCFPPQLLSNLSYTFSFHISKPMAYSSTYPAFPPPAYHPTYQDPSPYRPQPNSYYYNGTVPLHTTPIDPQDNGPPTTTTTYQYALSTYTHRKKPKTPKQQRREYTLGIIMLLAIIGGFSVLIWWGSELNERHKEITTTEIYP